MPAVVVLVHARVDIHPASVYFIFLFFFPHYWNLVSPKISWAKIGIRIMFNVVLPTFSL